MFQQDNTKMLIKGLTLLNDFSKAINTVKGENILQQAIYYRYFTATDTFKTIDKEKYISMC